MKILHVNTYDKGGAANACIRLHKSLLKKGIDSKLLVREKTKYIDKSFQFVSRLSSSQRIEGRIRRIMFELKLLKDPARSGDRIEHDRLNQELLRKGMEFISSPFSTSDITTSSHYKEADIVHFHWVSD